MSGAFSEFEVHYALGDFGRIWRDAGDPYYVWAAIKVCAENDVRYPVWVVEYLAECATRIIAAANKGTPVDVRENLPNIFRFVGKGSRLTGKGELLRRERFAMAFAAEIYAGRRPRDARDEASTVLKKVPDDRNLQKWLNKFFALKKGPPDWRAALTEWFGHHPHMARLYRPEFPSLPQYKWRMFPGPDGHIRFEEYVIPTT